MRNLLITENLNLQTDIVCHEKKITAVLSFRFCIEGLIKRSIAYSLDFTIANPKVRRAKKIKMRALPGDPRKRRNAICEEAPNSHIIGLAAFAKN